MVERLAQTRANHPELGPGPVPDPEPGQIPAEAQEPRPGARHCWVNGLPGEPGRWPGLLAEWSQREGGAWFGRVVYAVRDGGREVLVETWVPAQHLEPGDAALRVPPREHRPPR